MLQRCVVGFKTGANKFFYLDANAVQRWGIEEEFLKPVIKSPRECKSILIDPSRLKFKLFMCGKDREDLDGTAALEYIEWGESQEFDQRPSCSGRARWWDLGRLNGNILTCLWSDAYGNAIDLAVLNNAKVMLLEINEIYGVMRFKGENLVMPVT